MKMRRLLGFAILAAMAMALFVALAHKAGPLAAAAVIGLAVALAVILIAAMKLAFPLE